MNLEARLKRLENMKKGEQYSWLVDLLHEKTGMPVTCIERKYPDTVSLLQAIAVYHELKEC